MKRAALYIAFSTLTSIPKPNCTSFASSQEQGFRSLREYIDHGI